MTAIIYRNVSVQFAETTLIETAERIQRKLSSVGVNDAEIKVDLSGSTRMTLKVKIGYQNFDILEATKDWGSSSSFGARFEIREYSYDVRSLERKIEEARRASYGHVAISREIDSIFDDIFGVRQDTALIMTGGGLRQARRIR